jgi:hypothetical protein
MPELNIRTHKVKISYEVHPQLIDVPEGTTIMTMTPDDEYYVNLHLYVPSTAPMQTPMQRIECLWVYGDGYAPTNGVYVGTVKAPWGAYTMHLFVRGIPKG